MKKIIFLALLFCTSLSFSQSVTGESELYADYKNADKKLNFVYSKLIKKLNAKDKKNLTEAQKAWIKFRDINCKFKSQDTGYGGGPLENKMKIDCQIHMTMERTKELENFINGF